jgi:transcription elongation factor
LFNPKEVTQKEKERWNPNGEDLLFWKWDNKYFRKGMYYKFISLKNIDTVNIQPTLEELQVFSTQCT